MRDSTTTKTMSLVAGFALLLFAALAQAAPHDSSSFATPAIEFGNPTLEKCVGNCTNPTQISHEGAEKRLAVIPDVTNLYKGTAFTLTDNLRVGPTGGESFIHLSRPQTAAELKKLKPVMVDDRNINASQPIALEGLVEKTVPTQTAIYKVETVTENVNGTNVTKTVQVFDHYEYGVDKTLIWQNVKTLDNSVSTSNLRVISANLNSLRNFKWSLWDSSGVEIIDPWWNLTTPYKFSANQTFNLTDAQTSFQLPINFSTTTPISTAKMLASMADVYAVNGSETTSFNRYVEEGTNNTANSVVWACADTVANGVNPYFIYYGNNASNTAFVSPYASGCDSGVTLWDDFSFNTTTTAINNSYTPAYNMTCNAAHNLMPAIYGSGFNSTGVTNVCNTFPTKTITDLITGNNTFTWEYVFKVQGAFNTNVLQGRAVMMRDGNGYVGGLEGYTGLGGSANSTSLNFPLYDGTGYVSCHVSNLAVGNWYHVVLNSHSLQSSSTLNNAECYLNGVLAENKTYLGIQVTTGVMQFMGGAGVGNTAQPILLDSLALWNTNHSADWVKARYQALVNSSWTFGSEETNIQGPSVVLNAPANNTGQTNNTVVFNATPTQGTYALANLTIYGNWTGTWAANATNTSALTSGSPTTISIASIQNVSFVWNAYACDTTGNCSFATANFTYVIDPTNPVVTANAPADQSWTSNLTVDFNFTASDNYQLKNATVYTNITGTWAANATNSSVLVNNTPSIVNINFTPTQSTVLWSVEACDTFGNCVFSTNRSINLDTTSPAATLNSPSNSSFNASTNVTFKFTPTDNFFALKNATLWTNYSGVWAANQTNTSAMTNNTGNQLYSVVGFNGNTTLWAFQVCDSAANCAFSGNFTFSVDSSVPVVTAISPLNTNVTYGSPVSVRFNVTSFSPFSCHAFVAGTNQSTSGSSGTTTAEQVITLANFSGVPWYQTTWLWFASCTNTAGNGNATVQSFTWEESADEQQGAPAGGGGGGPGFGQDVENVVGNVTKDAQQVAQISINLLGGLGIDLDAWFGGENGVNNLIVALIVLGVLSVVVWTAYPSWTALKKSPAFMLVFVFALVALAFLSVKYGMPLIQQPASQTVQAAALQFSGVP